MASRREREKQEKFKVIKGPLEHAVQLWLSPENEGTIATKNTNDAGQFVVVIITTDMELGDKIGNFILSQYDQIDTDDPNMFPDPVGDA